MSVHPPGRRIVIGLGNEYRRDDGFGPLVVAALAERRGREPRLAAAELWVSDGDPARLLDLWAGADLVVLVDAVRGGDQPGRVYELVVDDVDRPAGGTASSHGISLGSTVALARALGRLPRRLVVLAVSGREFGFGVDLSPQVAALVEPVARRAGELVAGTGGDPRAA
ncbi:hydrogenase maturation protease [Actinoplanes teichomyceticus]|uniref:Hydrogenase maturation protease n=1 Tax=Actinoplanes teichomyceticus TaxID=1867 RepID=A0A561VLS1_ACTTI|nr:hydrogenase maturation protease [Actinoplanes teichomyceticus]TWG12561.1 hydrogenase maturation protease [Actinoplanes teichomyceticus]GIF13927.1 peptidase M52 [Actinoplanes teichomyceticus]